MIKRIFIEERQKTFLVCMGLFLLTLPVSYGLSSVCTIVIGAFFILDTPSRIAVKIKDLMRNKLFIFFLCLYGLQLISVLYSENLSQALKSIRTQLPFVTLPLTILSEKIDTKQLFKLLKYFKYYLFALLLGGLVYQYFVHKTIMTFEHDTFATIEISTFYFSAFIYVVILESLFTLKEGKFRSLTNYVLILFFSFCLLLLGARISILILIVCFAIFLFNAFSQISITKRVLIAVAVSVVVLLTAYQVPQVKRKVDITLRTMDFDFKTILTKNQISNSRNSLEYRVLINYCAANILIDNPFGVGIGDYRDKLNEQYEIIDFRAGKTRKFNSHNQYMEEFIKNGFIGGIFFIFFMFFIVRRGLKNKGYFYYVSLYIVIVCLVESFFYRQHGVMFAAFFLPLFYNLERLNEN